MAIHHDDDDEDNDNKRSIGFHIDAITGDDDDDDDHCVRISALVSVMMMITV